MASFAPGNLVDLVQEDDARLFDALDSGLRHAVDVHELLFLFLHQVFERFRNFHPPLLRPTLKKSGEHVLEIDVDFFNGRTSNDFE